MRRPVPFLSFEMKCFFEKEAFAAFGNPLGAVRNHRATKLEKRGNKEKEKASFQKNDVVFGRGEFRVKARKTGDLTVGARSITGGNMIFKCHLKHRS